MNLSRRHQILPACAYCRTSQCQWRDTGTGHPERAEAAAITHFLATGHEVRIVTRRETILTLPKITAAAK